MPAANTNPRDELGQMLRKHLHCPACGPDLASMMVPMQFHSDNGGGKASVRVIAYRPKSIRLECRDCGLRFSIDPVNFADVRARQMTPPADIIENQARKLADGDAGQYLNALAAVRASAARHVRGERDRVISLHLDGVGQAQPRKGHIRFPPRRQAQR
jgi:hypothetical protein